MTEGTVDKIGVDLKTVIAFLVYATWWRMQGLTRTGNRKERQVKVGEGIGVGRRTMERKVSRVKDNTDFESQSKAAEHTGSVGQEEFGKKSSERLVTEKR